MLNAARAMPRKAVERSFETPLSAPGFERREGGRALPDRGQPTSIAIVDLSIAI